MTMGVHNLFDDVLHAQILNQIPATNVMENREVGPPCPAKIRSGPCQLLEIALPRRQRLWSANPIYRSVGTLALMFITSAIWRLGSETGLVRL